MTMKTLGGAMLALLWLGVAPALAGSRTFVAYNGVDTGTCPNTAPCRSFAYAASQTSPAGELVALTPGGYGPVTITQSISIVNDGVGTVSITVPSGGTGITVNAGSADAVHLRGIEIDGQNSGSNGIIVNSAGVVDVLNCVIRHVNNDGVYAGPNTMVNIINSFLSYNANGIHSNDNATLNIESTQSINNSLNGIETNGSTSIKRSNVSGNPYGITIGGGIGFIIDTVVVNNSIRGVDIESNNASAALVSHSTITNNGIGLFNAGNGGGLYTYGDNNIDFNQTDESGTITTHSTR